MAERFSIALEHEAAAGVSHSAIAAEAFATALAAIASRQDPQVARGTSTFLNKKSRLLDVQVTS